MCCHRTALSVVVMIASLVVLLRRCFGRTKVAIEHGAVTLVTGGGSGIGRALALQFAKRGNKIILVGRNAEALEQAAQTCREGGASQVNVVVADLTTREGTEKVVESVQRLHPDQLKYLVLNAGAGAIIPFSSDRHFEAVCRDVMEINYYANVRLLQGLLAVLEKTNTATSPSRIIAISSLAGVLPSILRSPYTASKHAFQGFMNALRGETSVPITLCCPGYVDTDFHQRAAVTTPSGGDGESGHHQRRGISPFLCAEKCVEGALRGHPEVIFTLSGKLGYKLRPFLTSLVDKLAKKKSLDSLKKK